MRAGPFERKVCPTCETEYFGGGLAKCMWLLCASAFVGVALSAATGWQQAIWLLPLLGALGALALMVRSKPLPKSQRWREACLSMAAPIALWLIFLASEAILRGMTR